METNQGITAAQARVLGVLRDADRPLTLSDMRESTGLHENTLRGHLEALVRHRSVTRIAVRAGGRGRPAWSYLARPSEYAALAMALAAGLADPDPQSQAASRDDAAGLEPAAVRGGRIWGERLRTQFDSVPNGRDRVLLALEHTGFSPSTDGVTVTLHSCPLLDAAQAHPAIVCAAHLGLVEGVLGQHGAQLHPRPSTLGCEVKLP